MPAYANSYRTGPDHHDRWASTATIIELNVGKGKYAGRYYTHVTYVCVYVLLALDSCLEIVDSRIGM